MFIKVYRGSVYCSRCVVVAGGTMQPISEFKEQLFIAAGSSSERVTHFSCGHVIPRDHILPIILCSGPTNKIFDFSFQNRSSGIIVSFKAFERTGVEHYELAWFIMTWIMNLHPEQSEHCIDNISCDILKNNNNKAQWTNKFCSVFFLFIY